MLKMSREVCTLPVIAKKRYSFEHSYCGGKDDDDLRSGQGIYHWIGPKSIEWYEGNFFKNTLNGYGDYRWRFYGEKGTFTTYEGDFYANDMHGYGTMSYEDGRTFTGLFRNNSRYGPGIQKYLNSEADVGLWRGNQLIRLSWQPIAPYDLVPDFAAVQHGKVYVDAFRKIMAVVRQPEHQQKMNAIQTLKKEGADPVWASNNWKKLFCKHMSDTRSPACYVEEFDKNFYKGDPRVLEEVPNTEIEISSLSSSDDNMIDKQLFYAWNDNPMIIDMMKYAYAHDKMRDTRDINLGCILNGPRQIFTNAGTHEKCCRMLLMACFVGVVDSVVRLVNENHVHPDVADMKGNSALMYATCGDHLDIIHFLVEAGADVNGYNDTCCTPLCVALMRAACAKRNIDLHGLIDAVIPIPAVESDEIDESRGRITEWKIDRHKNQKRQSRHIVKGLKSHSMKSVEPKNTRSNLSKKSCVLDKASKTNSKLKTSMQSINDTETDLVLDGAFYSYNSLRADYLLNVLEFFSTQTEACYLFEVDNIYQEVLDIENPLKKNKSKGKVGKNGDESPLMTKKSSYWNVQEAADEEMVARIIPTVHQLLQNGADPRLVRCPHPALHIALVIGSADILRLLLEHGANVNQIIYEPLNYMALDIVVSRPFNEENRDMIQVLLEHGADLNHRLSASDEPGPTLLHAIVMREAKDFKSIEIRDEILVLFAKHNYDPLIRYKGQSVIERMLNENLTMFQLFNAHAQFDRNAPINYLQQNILLKMFTKTYFMKKLRYMKFIDCKDLEWKDYRAYFTTRLSEKKPKTCWRTSILNNNSAN